LKVFEFEFLGLQKFWNFFITLSLCAVYSTSQTVFGAVSVNLYVGIYFNVAST